MHQWVVLELQRTICNLGREETFESVEKPKKLQDIWKIKMEGVLLFFPRVQTPCGRCAQVIIEG